MEKERKAWNNAQKTLRTLLDAGEARHTEAIQAFLTQHAQVHASAVADGTTWSFEDEILDDITPEAIRRIPNNCEHSVAWTIWHLARIEDVTMNLLVAGAPQLAVEEGWFERLGTPLRHTGNAMDVPAVAAFSAEIDLDALRAYRQAVGRRTRAIVQALSAADVQRKVDPTRVQRILDEGAVLEEARGVTEYWSKRNIAGLLLMPPTRHCFVHLNEALKLKERKG